MRRKAVKGQFNTIRLKQCVVRLCKKKKLAKGQNSLHPFCKLLGVRSHLFQNGDDFARLNVSIAKSIPPDLGPFLLSELLSYAHEILVGVGLASQLNMLYL